MVVRNGAAVSPALHQRSPAGRLAKQSIGAPAAPSRDALGPPRLQARRRRSACSAVAHHWRRGAMLAALLFFASAGLSAAEALSAEDAEQRSLWPAAALFSLSLGLCAAVCFGGGGKAHKVGMVSDRLLYAGRVTPAGMKPRERPTVFKVPRQPPGPPP
eukprot:TRINITY_DN65914_c0_g1_i1.p2 TRINITY_DN65914_c0_g1~~TRINITY_DN65914_c0_g1_i1.p2  ORF type:complete len:159 (+),score=35.46 TRINITY_DN65914_c0_g1_i1:117-593(+)